MQDEIVIFGGTFDPFHQGHLSAVNYLSENFSNVIIACTKQNPFKKEQASDFWLRLEMINIVLSAEFIKFQFGGFPAASQIYLSDHPYTYAKDFIEYLLTNNVKAHAWAVGPELVESVKNWKDWSKLGLDVVQVPEEIPLHSSEIRKNTRFIHPALNSFIKANKLYI